MLNLLEGLRDLKAPLASGTIILFALWLAFANEMARVDPGASLAGNVRRLTEYLGVAATLGIVAFLAYLLGLVLSLHNVVLRVASKFHWTNGRGLVMPRETDSKFHDHVNEIRTAAIKREVPPWAIQEAMDPSIRKRVLSEYDRRTEELLAKKPTSDLSSFRLTFGVNATFALRNDINLLAAQLQSVKEKSYEQYDKAKSEADFRAAIVLPLLAVAGVAGGRMALEGLPWAGVGILVVTVPLLLRLAITAVLRLGEANQIVVTALILGHVELPALAAVKDLQPAEKPSNFESEPR